MANILTAAEGSNVLRCAVDDAEMLALLPLVDAYLKNATGHDWENDSTKHPVAKSAARMLLVRWHEDPGGMAAGTTLGPGLAAALVQLEALALRYKRFMGGYGAGPVPLPGARKGDTVTTLTGLIGTTGDQSAAFEAVVTVDDEIQQVSTTDLSENWYLVHLTPVEDL